MKKVAFSQMRCSLARALDRMGDWWTPLIVRDVFIGVNRFDELVEDLGISRNLLTNRLNGLVLGGILERRAYQERPTRYDYVLTEAGRDLVPAIMALVSWGDRWAAPKEGAPMRLKHTACGHYFTATVCCSECGRPLVAEEVVVRPGPGGAALPGTIVVARRMMGEGRRDP